MSRNHVLLRLRRKRAARRKVHCDLLYTLGAIRGFNYVNQMLGPHAEFRFKEERVAKELGLKWRTPS